MTTMTKKNVLKLAMTIMAAFMFTAVMGQTYPANIETDYERVDETIYQTTGYGLRLYVAPDPFYNPNYDGSNPTEINTASQWRWESGAAWGGTTVKDWENENYVELAPAALPDAGNSITYWVKERFGATGCEDSGDGESKVVYVVGTPEITEFQGTAANGWQQSVNVFTNCEPAAAVITITANEEGLPETERAYDFGLNVMRYALDQNGDRGASLDVTNTFGREAGTMVEGSDLTFTTEVLPYFEGGATEYVFTLATTSLQSKISTVSAYREDPAATAPVYGVPDGSFSYIVALPPVTGPIYHIPNDAL